MTAATRPAVGVYGGTFDPIHIGHLRLAEELSEMLGLDAVRFIPAGIPPHRAAPQTAAVHRLEMLRRALAGNAKFSADAREIERAGPSYTVDTLTELRAEVGAQTPLWMLLGADAFLGLPSWNDWRRVLDLANIAVAARPGCAALGLAELPTPLRETVETRLGWDNTAAGAIRLLPMTPLDISSTAIRAARLRGASLRYLVPDAVLDYLHEHALYLHA
jgi:nicotinate-nucleotide adenylyltransferase